MGRTSGLSAAAPSIPAPNHAGESSAAARYHVREMSVGEAKASVEKARLQSLVHVLPDFVGQFLTAEDGQTCRLMAYAPKVRPPRCV